MYWALSLLSSKESLLNDFLFLNDSQVIFLSLLDKVSEFPQYKVL